tara:strand:+ start:3554 stop:4267 length:714 start_codon:yes stop_codon:yes gene_type:complete
MIDSKAFNSIKNFVSSLNECYGDNHKGLSLYNDLLEKTTNMHAEVISKHNDIFKRFCIDNEICILNKNYNLSVSRISFSDTIYIDISKILSEADSSEKEIIWKHIAVIYSQFKPSNHVKNMLTANKSNESNFLQDMIGKVENTIDEGSISNPMEAITKMMSSGVFSDLVGSMTNGLQSGDLNLGNLLGSVNEMVETMNVNDTSNVGNVGNVGNDKNPGNDNSNKKSRNKKKKKPRRK